MTNDGKLYPTLVLLVGETAGTLVSRVGRWFAAGIDGGFPIERFSADFRGCKIWSQSKRLTSFGLGTASENYFVGANDRTDVRILLVCETSALKELKEALQSCLDAETLWQEEGRHSLAPHIRLVLFGGARGDPVEEWRKTVKEVLPAGSSFPITLYLSDCNRSIVVSGEALLDAVEITVAIVLLGDQSAGGALERTWREAGGTVFTIALREHWHDGFQRDVGTVIEQGVRRRLESLMGGESPSRLQLQAILDEVVGKAHLELLTSAPPSRESWLKDVYEKLLPSLLGRAAHFAHNLQELRTILVELANAAEDRLDRLDALDRPLYGSQGASMMEDNESVPTRFFAWVRRLFGYSAQSETALPRSSPTVAGLNGAPPIAKYLRALASCLSETPRDEGFSIEPAEPFPSVPCHEWRAEKFHGKEEPIARRLAERLAKPDIDLPTLLAFQYLVGDSSLRDAAEKARRLRREIWTMLRSEVQAAWIHASAHLEEQELQDHKWQEHIYFNQIPPAPEITRFLFASAAILQPMRASAESRPVCSLLCSDRMYSLRLIKV